MAFTVHQIPDNIFNLARSPMIVVAGDSAVSDENYRVVVEVYAWEGDQGSVPSDPIATLDKVQNDDGLAKFNVAPIIEDLFTPNNPSRASLATEADGDGMIYNVVLKIGYSNGGAVTIDTTTSVVKATAGYALYPSDINDFTNRASYETTDLALTTAPEENRVLVKGEQAWIIVFWQGTATADVLTLAFSGTQSSGFPISTNITLSSAGGATPTDSQDFLIKQRIDSAYLDGLGYDVDREITLRLNGTNPDQVFTINYKDSPCLVGSDCIAFVNRFGVWDFIHVYAARKKGLQSDRIDYKSRVSTFDSNEVTYDTYNPAAKILRAKGTESYEVNTGWVTENHNDLFRDMMMSKVIYSIGEDKPLILQDTDVQFKNDYETDLINYTFRFKVASNYIQDVQ